METRPCCSAMTSMNIDLNVSAARRSNVSRDFADNKAGIELELIWLRHLDIQRAELTKWRKHDFVCRNSEQRPSTFAESRHEKRQLLVVILDVSSNFKRCVGVAPVSNHHEKHLGSAFVFADLFHNRQDVGTSNGAIIQKHICSAVCRDHRCSFFGLVDVHSKRFFCHDFSCPRSSRGWDSAASCASKYPVFVASATIQPIRKPNTSIIGCN